MAITKTKIQCEYCSGTGILGGNTCARCLGTGISNVLLLPNGFYHAVDVLDCFDGNEFMNLIENKSILVKLIISAGIINLNAGQTRDVLLWSFPLGTTTNTQLSILIGETL